MTRHGKPLGCARHKHELDCVKRMIMPCPCSRHVKNHESSTSSNTSIHTMTHETMRSSALPKRPLHLVHEILVAGPRLGLVLVNPLKICYCALCSTLFRPMTFASSASVAVSQSSLKLVASQSFGTLRSFSSSSIRGSSCST